MAAIKIKQGEDWVKLPNVGIQSGIADAPVDDKQYVRSNGEWVEIEESSKVHIIDFLDLAEESGTFTQDQFNSLSEAIMNDVPVYVVLNKDTENKSSVLTPASVVLSNADYVYVQTFEMDTYAVYFLNNTSLTWISQTFTLASDEYVSSNFLSKDSVGTGLSLSSDSFGLSTSGVTAGSYGPTTDVMGSDETTISIPQITVDEYGRVTSVVNRVYTSANTTYSAATTSADGLMSSTDKTKMNRIRSYTTATTVASLNVNYENIYVTLSANASLSASATGADYNGRTITAYVYTASARTITIPTTGNYVSMCGSSFTTVAGGWVEFNLTCINGIWHIAKLEQE